MIPGIAGDPLVYLDGVYTPLSQAKVSVLDRGFIFGDGVYEVVPAYGRKPFRMDEHLARLRRSLGKLRIAPPMDDAAWRALVAELIQACATPECLVYIQVTRGVALRDHAFPSPAVAPTVFAMATPFTRPDARAREQGLSVICIPDERWLHCDIKSVSLLGNVLAKQQAVDAGADEVIQLRDGHVTEGASSNIWVVSGGRLLAPPRDHLILEGIRYGLIAELAAQAGIPFDSRPIARDELAGAQEILLSSATREILPVVRMDGAPVGNGAPGPVYARLRAGYDARIAAL